MITDRDKDDKDTKVAVVTAQQKLSYQHLCFNANRIALVVLLLLLMLLSFVMMAKLELVSAVPRLPAFWNCDVTRLSFEA